MCVSQWAHCKSCSLGAEYPSHLVYFKDLHQGIKYVTGEQVSDFLWNGELIAQRVAALVLCVLDLQVDARQLHTLRFKLGREKSFDNLRVSELIAISLLFCISGTADSVKVHAVCYYIHVYIHVYVIVQLAEEYAFHPMGPRVSSSKHVRTYI